MHMSKHMHREGEWLQQAGLKGLPVIAVISLLLRMRAPSQVMPLSFNFPASFACPTFSTCKAQK